MRKIVCLGDSLTQGYLIESTESWVHLLNREFNSKFVNYGISGDTTTGMLIRLQQILKDEKPDMIILLGGTNDLSFGISDALILSNFLAITRHAKQYQTKVILGIPTPIFYDEDNSQEFVFLTLKEHAKRVEKFSKTLQEFAKEDHQQIIDFSVNMTENLFLEDGIHPSKEGHQQMKENVKNFLIKNFKL